MLCKVGMGESYSDAQLSLVRKKEMFQRDTSNCEKLVEIYGTKRRSEFAQQSLTSRTARDLEFHGVVR